MKGTAYLIQATLISIWWIGMLINKNFYDAFQFPGIGNTAFNALLLPDIVVIAFLSILRAYKNEKALEYIILGGFAFACLYCVNATILTQGGFLATTIMILGLFYNLFLTHQKRLFRISSTKSIRVNALKTIIQIVCVWIITLVVFPMLILNSFDIKPEAIGYSKPVGIFLFLIFSSLGIYSAYIMVKLGEGTPLPIDQTQKLVVAGPYKLVRNPMAIAGIGQGLAVSLIFQSAHILVYTILGLLLWQFVVRPIEENNMKERFGKEYEDYKKSVRCWMPKLK